MFFSVLVCIVCSGKFYLLLKTGIFNTLFIICVQLGRGLAKGKQLLLTYNDPKSARTNFLGFGSGPDATALWVFLETYGIYH